MRSRDGRNGDTRVDEAVRRAVDALLSSSHPIVIAVSGGHDSMCLLHAFGEHGREARITVATFDHGTGPHAAQAVSLVTRQARFLGFELVSARAWRTVPSEAAWRRARWDFLRTVARSREAVIATAHTLDDQLETIVMRLLRGAGGRGLAGLRSPSGRTSPFIIARPFLDLTRADLESWATRHAVPWEEDPSNANVRYLRNRVRRDLVPALQASAPDCLLRLDELSRELAGIRGQIRTLASDFVLPDRRGLMDVAAALLDADESSRRVLWAELLESVGIVLDRRGYVRLGRLDAGTPSGTMVPTSGGVAVTRMRDRLVVHPTRSAVWASVKLHRHAAIKAGNWLFRWTTSGDVAAPGSPWFSPVPARDPVVVRPWSPGDRWCGPGAAVPRLVSRYLVEAGIPPSLRKGWPVVEQNGEIVWVPGVRRAHAAPAPTGRPTAFLCCEPDHR